MIYFLFIVIQILSTFVIYVVLSKKLLQSNPLDQYRDEFNSLIIAFNRNAEDNISILEKRIDEVKALSTTMDEKLQRIKKEQFLNDNPSSKSISMNSDKSFIALEELGSNKKRAKKKVPSSMDGSLFLKYPHNRFEAYLDKTLEEDLLKKKEGIEIKELSLEEKIRKLSLENKDAKFLAKELQLSLDEVNFLMKKYRLIA